MPHYDSKEGLIKGKTEGLRYSVHFRGIDAGVASEPFYFDNILDPELQIFQLLKRA